MAILKCKMCGGTLEYDRANNLAVCPYCDSKSTVFEQDMKLFEQFQNQFRALLNREPVANLTEGFWVETTPEELEGAEGEVIEIAYLSKRRADMCTLYVTKKNIILVFGSEHYGSAVRYRDMVKKLQYPNEAMKEELKRYIPKLVAECRLSDGGMMLAIEKPEHIYPLRLMGTLLDRHVAWVVSRLENLCCLLDYNDVALNALTIDNLFVDPINHQIHLYGGWWFAGYQGMDLVGYSKEVEPFLSTTAFSLSKGSQRTGKNSTATDLKSLRLVAAKLLGYNDLEDLKEAEHIPKPFLKFLVEEPKRSAGEDFKEWDRVLMKSYGERKFIPLSMTEEEVYSQS